LQLLLLLLLLLLPLCQLLALLLLQGGHCPGLGLDSGIRRVRTARRRCCDKQLPLALQRMIAGRKQSCKLEQ